MSNGLIVKLPLAEIVIIQPQTKISPPHSGSLGFPRNLATRDRAAPSDTVAQRAQQRDNADVKNYAEYKADKKTFLCHIEYILAPEVQPKSVDIICWERVAKIYVEEDSAAIIPLACDKIFWIYFRLKHVTNINNERVNAYYNHNIALTVSLDGKKFGHPAKSEKVKVFYGPAHETGQLFPSLEEDPDDVASSRSKTTDRNGVLSTDFEANELKTKLRTVMQELTDEYHGGDRRTVVTGQKHPPWRTANNKAEGNTSKTTSTLRSKEDFNSDISFVITGESIFSGLKVIENYVKYKSEELPLLYSAVQVNNVLDPELAVRYNPLSITLKHLNYMPVSALHKEHVKKVRFCYTVCDIYEAVSNDIGIGENTILNYTRTILTDAISTPELIEYIQTKGLTITLLGVREGGGDEMENVKPNMYKDQRINCKSGLPGLSPKNRPLDKRGTVILGVAKIDISSILLDPHQLLVKYNFNCGEFDCAPSSTTEFYTTVNPTEVNNIDDNNKKRDGLCHELISSSAVLTVSVRLSVSLKKSFEAIKQLTHIRNRIFVVTNDVTAVANILKIIQSQSEILAPTDYSKSATQIDRPASVRCSGATQTNPESKALVLTGFLIDCVDHFLLYVDGARCGVLQEIWSAASSIRPSKGHVLYDSSLLFNQISYEDLIRFGGFYIISLGQAPAVLMNNKNSYKKGNIPSPAFKALIKLYHLSRCLSITKAVQCNLFPSSASLLSLDLEFGVPHMFPQSST